MTKLHRLIFVMCLLVGFTSLTLAQSSSKSNLRIPKLNRSHTPYVHTPTASINDFDMAYGWSSINSTTLSMPIPAGTPFTSLAAWTPPVFASTAVRGPDGTYYVVDVGPPSTLWTMDPTTGAMTEVGTITGIESGGSANGMAYDAVNNTFYLAAGVFTVTNNLYSFDPSTLTATLVGAFPNTTGAMIDIAINSSGVGFGYDLVDDNAYTFDPVSGTTTLLGSLGYDANYGQGMDIKQDDGTIFLSAFNNTTITGQLRTMDPATGATTLVVDWGFDQVAPFAINNTFGPQPGPGPATNPDPANGATGVDINAQLSWTNPSGATSLEVFFGTSPGSMTSIYSGTPVTTVDPGTKDYMTSYYWRVDETDGSGTTTGSNWSFQTMQNPLVGFADVMVYPQDVSMWTGNTEGTVKTDGTINTIYPNVGWAVYDISALPSTTVAIDSVRFYGWVNDTNWPYWSSTPMGSVNPVSDDAGTINSQIQANYGQAQAYIYSDEASTFSTGWHNYLLGNTANADLFAAVPQGWFAQGFIDRDFSTSYYVNFDGHSDANPPYLHIYYEYITPVELTSFKASTVNGNVNLTWATATETNNKGFQVERKSADGQYQNVAFVNGHGTTTQPEQYTYMDQNVAQGHYTYRLKQMDFDGSYKYSNAVEVDVTTPAVYSLDQNYPNPFNPTTKIDFSLANNSKVTLKVYDVLGRQIAELLNSNLTAGSHTVNFNASSIPSGVYFYRLEAKGNNGKDFTSIKKMILMK